MGVRTRSSEWIPRLCIPARLLEVPPVYVPRSYPLAMARHSSVGLATSEGALRLRPNVEGASRQSFRIIHARLCQRGRLSMYTFRSPRTSSTVCSSSRVGMRGCGHASALHRQPSRSMPRVLIHRFPRQVWKCSFTLLAQSVGSTNGLLTDKEERIGREAAHRCNRSLEVCSTEWDNHTVKKEYTALVS